MPKLTFEKIQSSKEYKILLDLYRVCEEYNLTEDSFFAYDDLGGIYWEPLLDRLFRLGVCFKFTKKLKEIKMDWLRPVLYFQAQSNGIIIYDKRKDIVDKGAIVDASMVRYAFKDVINRIRDAKNMNEENFKQVWKVIKKDIKYFFKVLNKYIKEGFRAMHEHVKLILYPLRMLRKSGYRLFSLEKFEEHYRDLTIFQDKENLKEFIDSIKDFFKWEKFKTSKECDNTLLDEFLHKNTNPTFYLYNWSNEKRLPKVEEEKKEFSPYATQTAFHQQDLEKSDKKISAKQKKINREQKLKFEEEKQKHDLIFPNIKELSQPEATRLKHEAYQLKFEEGLHLMIEYLIPRLSKDFPYSIDTHKIFVNLKYVPDGRKIPSTEYYLGQLYNKIEDLKIKCYEMKLNGLSRVLMPITKNTEIIQNVKEIFDLHVIIDNIMGSYLLYDQYIFIFNSIKFIVDSTLNDQIEKFKNKQFMEERIPRYVLFQAMCKGVDVLNNMILHSKEIGEEVFNIDNYYQIKKHEIDSGDNEVIYAYEVPKLFKSFVTPEMEEKKKILFEEIKQFGRYWMFEGFFPKEDKDLWIEAIELLRNVNELVREDIRDYLLYPKEEMDLLKKSSGSEQIKRLNSNSSLERSSSSNTSKKKLMRKPSKNKGLKRKKSSIQKIKKSTKLRRKGTFSSRDSFEFEVYIPNNLELLRPPNVWNFPLHKVQDLKNKKILAEDGVVKAEIREVDPTVNYHDGRIQKFYQLFDTIYNNMRVYCTTKKADIFNYYFDKVLVALGIHYSRYDFKKGEEDKKEDEINTENEIDTEKSNMTSTENNN